MEGDEREGGACAEALDIGAVAAPGRERRLTARGKRDAALRLLRGEPLEIAAREPAVRAAALSGGSERLGGRLSRGRGGGSEVAGAR